MTPMSPGHKAALAEGRELSKAVRQYLEAIDSQRPKRGRRRTPESIAKRLNDITTQLDAADPIKRLQLIQERMDLSAELASLQETPDLSLVEKAFVAAAQGYSERKGITYAAWREVGVPAEVLKRAGIARSTT